MLRDYESKVLAAKVGVVLGVVAFFVVLGLGVHFSIHDDGCDDAADEVLGYLYDWETNQEAVIAAAPSREDNNPILKRWDRYERAKVEVLKSKCGDDLKRVNHVLAEHESWRLERE